MNKKQDKTGKRVNKSWFYLGIILLVVLIIFTTKFFIPSENEAETGDSAAVKLAESRDAGMPVWLLFHSTSCESCIEMEGIFNELQPEFTGQVAFIEANVYDQANEELLSQYGIQYIPTSYLLDESGKTTTEAIVGVVNIDEMRLKIAALAGGR